MKHSFTITVDKDIYDLIKKMAIDEGRNVSNMIEYILRRYLLEK